MPKKDMAGTGLIMTDEKTIDKSRIWLAVTYPENMVEGWQDDADEIIQLPYCYCIHNGDNLKETIKGDIQQRKAHVHWIIVFKNTTTRKHALSVANLLSAPGQVCCSGVKACLDVRHAYDYLIHDTQNARKKKKELYPKSARIEGNNFDIGAYEQLSQDEKNAMADELLQFAIKWNIKDMSEFYVKMQREFDFRYFDVFRSANAMIDRVCRGNLQQAQRKQKPMEAPSCAVCGSKRVAGSYVTEKGRFWFCNNCQETAYTVLNELDL